MQVLAASGREFRQHHVPQAKQLPFDRFVQVRNVPLSKGDPFRSQVI